MNYYQVFKCDKDTRVVDIMMPCDMHELLCEHFGVSLETIALALDNKQSIDSIAHHTKFSQIGSDCSVDDLINRIINSLKDIRERVREVEENEDATT